MFRKYLNYFDYLISINCGVLFLASLLSYRQIKNNIYNKCNSLYLPQEDFNNNKFEECLFGTDDYKGFFELSYDYKNTDLEYILKLYISMCLLNNNDYVEANKFLNDITLKIYKIHSDIIKSKVFALKGDTDVELKKYDDALLSYNKAIEILENNYIDNPRYIMKIVYIYEEKGEYKKTLDLLNDSIKKYEQYPDLNVLKLEKKRLEVFLNSK